MYIKKRKELKAQGKTTKDPAYAKIQNQINEAYGVKKRYAVTKPATKPVKEEFIEKSNVIDFSEDKTVPKATGEAAVETKKTKSEATKATYSDKTTSELKGEIKTARKDRRTGNKATRQADRAESKTNRIAGRAERKAGRKENQRQRKINKLTRIKGQADISPLAAQAAAQAQGSSQSSGLEGSRVELRAAKPRPGPFGTQIGAGIGTAEAPAARAKPRSAAAAAAFGKKRENGGKGDTYTQAKYKKDGTVKKHKTISEKKFKRLSGRYAEQEGSESLGTSESRVQQTVSGRNPRKSVSRKSMGMKDRRK